MEREIAFTPETEMGRERTSLRKIFEAAKKKISEGLAKFMLIRETVREEILRGKKVKPLDEQAGDYFRSLIPQSQHPPKKEYHHQNRDREVVKRHSVGYGDVVEYPLEDGMVMEEIETAVRQDDSPNLICERVRNYVFPSEPGLKSSQAFSDITVRNEQTGKVLDLGQFLPSGCKFAPDRLDQRSSEMFKDEHGKYQVRTFQEFHSLGEYEGAGKKAGEHFSHVGRPDGQSSRVKYGDLTEKGGMLSLLHEVAHAYQDVYGLENGRRNFEKFYKKVSFTLRMLQTLKQWLTEGEISDDSYKQNVLSLTNDLLENGVEVDPEELLELRPLAEGNVRVIECDPLQDYKVQMFTVQSDKMEHLVDDYAREERDAWAHAISVLFFLRRQGFDLEPELKSLKDIQTFYNKCLDTYQFNLETQVELPAGREKKKFKK